MDRLTPISSPFPGVSKTKPYLPAFFSFPSGWTTTTRPSAQSHAYTHLLETIYRLLIWFCLSVLISFTLTFTPLPFYMDPYRHRLTVPALHLHLRLRLRSFVWIDLTSSSDLHIALF